MSPAIDTPVAELNRVGRAAAKCLQRLGIATAKDLLFYFPFRYEDFSLVAPIKDVRDHEAVTVRGKIELIANKRSLRKRTIITEALVADGTGRLRAVWFGQPFIAKNLKVGDTVYLSGSVASDMFGRQMVSPSYEKERMKNVARPDRSVGEFRMQNATTHTARIVPIYSTTSGLTQKQIRFLMKQVVPLATAFTDWLPAELRERADLQPLADAIRAIHFPENRSELKYAERRLKFDELFVLQLRAEMIRQSLKRVKAPALHFQEQETRAFVASLPFILTKDQKIAAWEILRDLERLEPMNRLLEGDVGSGKTVVGAMALYNCVLNGYQGVMLAPTEILAAQHYNSITALLPDKKITLLTGSEIRNWSDGSFGPYGLRTSASEKLEIREKLKTRRKEELLRLIKVGEAELIIGTHAILQEDVQFKKLGLVVVDEQQRFGVEQRKALRERSGEPGMAPHFLSMSATPIPRSFALTLYGDLDISLIKEKPPGRQSIITRLVEPKNREKAYQFIRGQIKVGRQAFVICPLISNEEEGKGKKEKGKGELESYISHFPFPISDDKKSVLSEYKKLSGQIFPDLRVGCLHGRMRSKEKDETMKKFVTAELDILVSTAVVEVGVDIPNASVMMIEGAERFGLAQLHQFRGRVGRSDQQSYCLLFTEIDAQTALQRLAYFEKNTDGFKLAEYDLETRGPGEVYGTAQSGMMNLKLATMKDIEIIKLARELARGIDFTKYPSLREKVKEWERTVHLE